MTTPTPPPQQPEGAQPVPPTPSAEVTPQTATRVVPLRDLVSATVETNATNTIIGVTVLPQSVNPAASYAWLQTFITADWVRSVFPELSSVPVTVEQVPTLRGWSISIAAPIADASQAQGLVARLLSTFVNAPVALLPQLDDAPEEKKSSNFLWALIAVLAIAAVGGLVLLLGGSKEEPAPEPTSTTVTVPSVIGFSITEATAKLESAGLVLGDITEAPSEQPNGQVLEQTPLNGEVVAQGARVNLVVAGSPAPVIPDVVGLSQTDATNALLNAGFRVGAIDSTDSDQPAGTVVSQSPAAGTTSPRDTEIALTISNGTVTVPPVVGYSQAEAEQLLRNAGFEVSSQTRESSQVGIVLEQSPAAGSKLEIGKTIVITVGAAAPSPSATPTPSP